MGGNFVCVVGVVAGYRRVHHAQAACHFVGHPQQQDAGSRRGHFVTERTLPSGGVAG
jgi:hypothetical protein